MSADHTFSPEPSETGGRLDRFLAGRLPALSRSRIQALIKAGHILRNGHRTRASETLRAGDAIAVSVPAPVAAETAPEDIPLAVLFEDDDLIVIDKPAGLVVHPAVGNEDGTLVNALLHHCPALSGIGGERRPGIVHRLDKETSGCLVAAKCDAAHQSLSAQFAGRTVTKIYLALAARIPAKRSGTIDAPIARNRVHRQKMTVVAGGRTAVTDWRVLGEVPGGSIVECTLHSGRTHQIRVHLRHLGHPVLGDEVYGKRGHFPRQMLHAWRLGFTHPATGAALRFEAPVPADFIAAGCPAEI